jgi:uncharacterized protein YxjI
MFNCTKKEIEKPPTPLKSITLKASKSIVLTSQKITFSVIGNDGYDITDKTTIKVGGKIVSANYTTTTSGNYTAKATYEGFSSSINFSVKDPHYTTKILVEDYTKVT